ncbi:MAG: isoleucine--tRNA ligase [Candidatus Aenigmarchaeota archaeon]|nr:isoleucine--tRNA ligase [Candidatus Aenigmarchaeota archaeon]
MYEPKKLEKKIMELWEKKGIMEKVLVLNKGKKKFYFHDGPPYATGQIHLGTAWNKSMKDLYMRFNRMRGKWVWCQPGYDTHGTPIENKIEKEMDFKDKKDIEKFGIDNFNKKCREFATKNIEKQNQQYINLGVWMDWKNPYITLNKEFIEGCWFTFKEAFDKGFLYKGVYPVHACPHCGTAVAYNEIEYTKIKDKSQYVKFKVKGENKFLIIWTTTAWTLPGNMGIMVHPDFEYAEVEVDMSAREEDKRNKEPSAQKSKETWIVAKELVEKLEKIFEKKLKIKKVFKGKKLEGMKYEHPLAVKMKLPKMDNVHRVVLSEKFVNLESGTGLVHTAPGHGKEDFEVGEENGLPAFCPVGLDGKLSKETGKYSGKEARLVDTEIREDLEEGGNLVATEMTEHDYPICWRCKTPLLQIVVPQWFFGVTKIRDKLLKENEKVKWVPENAGKRFKDWLENLGDWPISRQRFWGIPLPIWICDKCEGKKVVGSLKELGIKMDDLHRPYIDEVTFKCKCGGKMFRVKDVSDVWFDSGCSSWACLGYPSNKELFKKLWPSDFILEGSDQFRGWYNSQMLAGVMTFGKCPYTNVVVHGMVLGLDKREMHKSLGNFITPEEIIEKYGRDIFRYYLLKLDNGTNPAFSWEDVETGKKSLNFLHNIVNYYETYGKKGKEGKLNAEDKWILSRMNNLIIEVEKDMGEFVHYKALQKIEKFLVDDFSRFYLKLARGRDTSFVVGYCLERLVKIIAGFCPFITEEIYQKLFKEKESVHMESWSKADKKRIDGKLEEKMEIVQKIIEAGNALRLENKIKLKYVLPALIVSGGKDIKKAVDELKEVLLKMGNVKEVKFAKLKEGEVEIKLNYKVAGVKFGKDVKEIAKLLEKLKKVSDKIKIGKFILEKEDVVVRESGGEGKSFGMGRVNLDLNITDELREEWLVRELIRAVQSKRKEMGLEVKDKVKLFLDKKFSKHKKIIEEATNSRMERLRSAEEEHQKGKEGGELGSVEFEGKKYSFGIKK